SEVDLLALRADPLAVRFERRQLVLENHLRIVEQPADQGGLAVVDAAAGDEPQQALVLVQLEIGLDVLGDEGVGDVGGVGHQKYPSCFFFSMPAPPASLSIARPWRSLVVVRSISCTTSASVAASLSTAPVSG